MLNRSGPVLCVLIQRLRFDFVGTLGLRRKSWTLGVMQAKQDGKKSCIVRRV